MLLRVVRPISIGENISPQNMSTMLCCWPVDQSTAVDGMTSKRLAQSPCWTIFQPGKVNFYTSQSYARNKQAIYVHSPILHIRLEKGLPIPTIQLSTTYISNYTKEGIKTPLTPSECLRSNMKFVCK